VLVEPGSSPLPPPTRSATQQSASQAQPETSDAALSALLKSLPSRSSPSLEQAEISLLLGAFSPDVDARARSLAFLVLAQLANARPATSTTLERYFAPRLEDILVGTDPRATEQALALLAALSQTGPAAALAIVRRPGFQENLFDLLDLFPATETSALPVALALADLVSQICNSAEGRTALLLEGCDWKATLARQSSSSSLPAGLRAAATVALAKLSRGKIEGAEGTNAATAADPGAAEDEAVLGRSDERLAVVLKGIVESTAVAAASSQPKAVVDAVEGLALTSYRPKIKELLSTSPGFLGKLFAVVPPPPKARAFNDPTVDTPAVKAASVSSLQYGVATIIANLAAYKPILSTDEAQVDRLRKLTLAKQGGKTPPAEDDPLEAEPVVARRGKKLLDAGVVAVLVSLGRSDSRTVRETVGRAFLALVHVQTERATVIKAGGAKALLGICSSLLALPAASSSSPPTLDATLPALQALAKILITASPFVVFGPSASSTAADAIRPLALLLAHDSSSLLQRFEALMALTNLASVGPSMAERIAAFQDRAIVSKMEDLMLNENALVRRAATELLCNLLAAEPLFLAWSGEPASTAPPDAASTARPASTRPAEKRLHILLALSTVSDVPTQLAASGALATLASSPTACRLMLVRKEGPARPIQSLLELLLPSTSSEDDDAASAVPPTSMAHPGLVHRAAVVLTGVLEANAGDAAVTAALQAANARSTLTEVLEDVEIGMPKGPGSPRDEIASLLRQALRLLPAAVGTTAGPTSSSLSSAAVAAS